MLFPLASLSFAHPRVCFTYHRHQPKAKDIRRNAPMPTDKNLNSTINNIFIEAFLTLTKHEEFCLPMLPDRLILGDVDKFSLVSRVKTTRSPIAAIN
jgi:hypothetical protein